MNKTYIIEPERIAVPFIHYIPEEIQVIFTSSKVKLMKGKPYQTVTTCLFREHLTCIGMGYTIENPNDERDDEEGRRWAYKRAVQSMLNRISYDKRGFRMDKKTRKVVDRTFRIALREAKNGDN